jgi:hypothetical protein
MFYVVKGRAAVYGETKLLCLFNEKAALVGMLIKI